MEDIAKLIIALIGSIFAYTLVRLKDWADARRKRIEEHLNSLVICERNLTSNLMINRRNLAVIDEVIKLTSQGVMTDIYFHGYNIDWTVLGNIKNIQLVNFISNVLNRIDNTNNHFAHLDSNFKTLKAELIERNKGTQIPMDQAQSFFTVRLASAKSTRELIITLESDIKDALAGIQVTFPGIQKKLKRWSLGYQAQFSLPPDFETLRKTRRQEIDKAISEGGDLKWL